MQNSAFKALNIEFKKIDMRLVGNQIIQYFCLDLSSCVMKSVDICSYDLMNASFSGSSDDDPVSFVTLNRCFPRRRQMH